MNPLDAINESVKDLSDAIVRSGVNATLSIVILARAIARQKSIDATQLLADLEAGLHYFQDQEQHLQLLSTINTMISEIQRDLNERQPTPPKCSR